VERWLQWVEGAEKLEARQRGAVNMRDDKLRQFAFRWAVSQYSGLLEGLRDSDGLALRLGAASTGPVAEAYVGGGS
jgi:hypothetical protein